MPKAKKKPPSVRKVPSGGNLQRGVILRASEEQFELWRAKAERAGLTLSEWARRALDVA